MAIIKHGRKLKASIFHSSALLSRSDRRKFSILTIIQSALGLLDLVSVAIVGIIASIAVNGISNLEPGKTATKLLDLLNLQNFSIQIQAALLSVIVGTFLIAKSVASMYMNRRLLFFLSYRSASVSKQLIRKLVKQSALVIESKSAQELIYSATTGVNSIVVGVLGNFSLLIGDVSLCLILGIGLIIYNPATSILTLLILGGILLSLFRYLNRETVRLVSNQTKLGIENAEMLAELISNYRESIVRNRRGYYSKSLSRLRDELAELTAKQSWLPNISKYVIEMTVTAFTLILAFLQFRSLDAVHAVGSLAIFLVAGARLAPSLLRIQQNVITMNSHSAAAEPTFELFNTMKNTIDDTSPVGKFQTSHLEFKPNVEVLDLKFQYPDSQNMLIEIPNLQIISGEFIAIVGPSGAGKSTLIDLILGILKPEQGSVKISGLDPEDTFTKWPGAVSYVAQNINFPSGSIRDCLSGGYEDSEVKLEQIWTCLEKVSLSEYVASLPSGIDESLGEGAMKLSGGQRQRLSIARALLTEPKFLVMDEATSSLDSETEQKVGNSIQQLKGEVTLLVVAHRLSTVRMADRILYMEAGKIVAQGGFEELRATIPNFNKQATLMGL